MDQQFLHQAIGIASGIGKALLIPVALVIVMKLWLHFRATQNESRRRIV